MLRDRLLLAGGGAGVLLALAGIVVAPSDAVLAWLAAAFLWSGIPTGSLGLLMMIRLIPGRWGHELMLPLETSLPLLPIPALAMLPVLIGMSAIYPWIGQPQVSEFKSTFLSPLSLVAQTLLWFAFLGTLSWLLIARRGSARAISAVGLIVLPVAGSIVTIAWLLSLDPRFHSSGFGLYALAIQFASALAFATLAALLHDPERTSVIGGVLLTMLLLWAYFLFMIYFVAWSGNLKPVVPWYLRRSENGWDWVMAASVGLHMIPLLLLVLPSMRRSGTALKVFALAILTGGALDSAWLVLPEGGGVFELGTLIYLLAALGLGCLTIAGYRRLLFWRVAGRAPAEAS